jgi:hypothetical protein
MRRQDAKDAKKKRQGEANAKCKTCNAKCKTGVSDPGFFHFEFCISCFAFCIAFLFSWRTWRPGGAGIF